MKANNSYKKSNSAINKVTDLVVLNLTYVACCVPIVTIGAASTALYYVTLKMSKNEEYNSISFFWKSFKQNFKQATAIWLIELLVAALLVLDITFTKNIGGNMSFVLRYIWMFLGFMILLIGVCVFPFLSKFDNTVKNTIKNAALVALGRFPVVLGILIINLIPIILFFVLTSMLPYLLSAMTIIGFAAIAYACSILFNGIFDKYIIKKED